MVGRWTTSVHALVVVVQPDRRAGIAHPRHRGEGEAVPRCRGGGMRGLRARAAAEAPPRTAAPAGKALMPRAKLFGKPLPDGGTIGVAATPSPYFNRSG